MSEARVTLDIRVVGPECCKGGPLTARCRSCPEPVALTCVPLHQPEHYMPGNRRRGLGIREKRGFETEAEARTFLDACGRGAWRVYECGVCGKWHTAKPGRV